MSTALRIVCRQPACSYFKDSILFQLFLALFLATSRNQCGGLPSCIVLDRLSRFFPQGMSIMASEENTSFELESPSNLRSSLRRATSINTLFGLEDVLEVPINVSLTSLGHAC